MIGGLLQGIFGQKDAEITETVYFDVSIDGQAAGRIEMGLYGSTVPKVCWVYQSPKVSVGQPPGPGFLGFLVLRSQLSQLPDLVSFAIDRYIADLRKL